MLLFGCMPTPDIIYLEGSLEEHSHCKHFEGKSKQYKRQIFNTQTYWGCFSTCLGMERQQETAKIFSPFPQSLSQKTREEERGKRAAATFYLPIASTLCPARCKSLEAVMQWLWTLTKRMCHIMVDTNITTLGTCTGLIGGLPPRSSELPWTAK